MLIFDYGHIIKSDEINGANLNSVQKLIGTQIQTQWSTFSLLSIPIKVKVVVELA